MQKSNDVKGWKCTDFNELYDKIADRGEANRVINSSKICDPAVGSVHFLVSALNEIIAVKSELKILSDREGKRLKEYQVEAVFSNTTPKIKRASVYRKPSFMKSRRSSKVACSVWISIPIRLKSAV